MQPLRRASAACLGWGAMVQFLLIVLCMMAGPALAAKAHEHGVVRLSIAVDAQRITLALDSPLENLVGFEHSPRTDAERRVAEAALARLRNAAKLFRIDPAAQCTLATVDLVSAPLKLGAPTGQDRGHGDLEGGFEFNCKDARRAGFIEVGLFAAFARLQRIEVQMVSAKGQHKVILKRPAGRVSLAR